MNRFDAVMLADFDDNLIFAREQQVQHVIGLIQKVTQRSILDINEAAIRVAVDAGIPTSLIVRRMLADVVKES